MALNFPMTQGKIPYDQLTMSLTRGILLTLLNDDVISGMHSSPSSVVLEAFETDDFLLIVTMNGLYKNLTVTSFTN
jgi:hypothetical protein